MFEFLFDTPLLIAGPVIVVSLCSFGLVGLLAVRRCVLPRLRIHDSDSGFCGAMQQAVMVFYGLVVALILVNVWQRYSDPEDVWLQGIQVSLLAAFIGMAIFLIFAFDRPFRGELGLRPDSYQLIYDQLMKP